MAPQHPHRLRLGFAGTPVFAATLLNAILRSHEVAVVYCQPPKPKGRGRREIPSPVETLARTHEIEVRSPRSLRNEAAALRRDALDVFVVAAYGLILPKPFLEVPRHGCINVHASMLPRWRGAAPIERAIMAGDTSTGISIMQMDEGLDTGPVLLTVECPISGDDTGDTLRDRLALLGGGALSQCLAQLGTIVAHPQSPQGVTYASKIGADESRIDWRASATDTALKIRALNSRQPAFCIANGERIRLLAAVATDPDTVEVDHPGEVVSIDRRGIIVSCGRGRLCVTRVALTRGQGKPMDVASLINGYPELIRAGQLLLDASS